MGLQPEVKIYDVNDTLLYTWQSSQIESTPTQDFDLYGWTLHGGINTDFGSLSLNIHDIQNLLTDLTSPRRPSKIQGEYRIDFFLGKDSAGMQKWFQGKIRDSNISRLPGRQEIGIFAVGWGTVLSDRLTIIKHFQKKDETIDDGITLDENDNDAKISEIAKRIMNNQENNPIPTLSHHEITTNGIEEISIKLADFKKHYQSISSSINELANSANAIWGIDYSGIGGTPDMWMRYRSSAESGILLTNNLDEALTQGWNPGNLTFLLKSPSGFADSTVDYGYSVLYGIGPYHDTLDHDKSTANASFDLSAYHHSFAIIPAKDNLSKISLYLKKVNTPSKDLKVEIIGTNANGKPNPTDLRIRRIIRKETLQAIKTGGQYIEVSLGVKPITVQTNQKIFIFIPKYEDSANCIKLDYQTGSGEYWNSSNGTTWNDPPVGSIGKFTGEARIRTYSSKEVVMKFVNLSAFSNYGIRELPIPLSNVNDVTAIDILAGVSESVSKHRRVYKPLTMTVPSNPIPLGKKIRLKDKFNGLDVFADIIGYDISANAYDLQTNGAHTMQVNLEEVFFAK